MIAGGASFAPSRWSLPALAMAARSSPCHCVDRPDAPPCRTPGTACCRADSPPGDSRLCPSVVAHRPVEVLARAVHPGKRLLVQQARQPVFRRHPLQRLHHHHLVVGGDVGVLEHRRNLILARRDFVVARLHRHAHAVELGLGLVHERHHPIRNGAEILVLEFLPLRRLGPEQRPPGVDQVGPRQVEVPVDQEIFLLGPAGRDHALGLRPEQLQHAHRLLRQRFHRAQQRRLLVERFAGPAHKRRRDDQRHRAAALQQPRRAGRVPRRVAARLEGACACRPTGSSRRRARP